MPPSVPLMKIAKRKKGKMLKKKIKKKVGAKKPLVVAAKKVEEPVKEPEIVEDVEGEEVEEDDEVDEDDSDHDEDMMNDNADGTVNMDFEAVPPSEEDREGLSNMLSQIFLKGEVSTNALIGGIIGQAPFGCVFVSTEEELDDEEDGVLYGVVTVLELGGKGKVYGKLLKFLVEKAKKHGDNNIVQRIERLGREAPEKKRIGVLINERMLNFPTQICGPSFSALIEDMKTGGKQFDFKEIVVISKIRLGNIPDADTVAGPRAQGQSKKKGKGKKKQLVAKALTQADVIFDNPEEELLFQRRAVGMESAVNTPTTSGRLPSNPQGLPPTSFEGFKTRFIASKETRQGVRKIRLTFVCSNPFEEKVVETPDTVAFISIGRNKNCTVTIPKVQQLSQIHCQIIRKENEEGVVHYEVENCSTNGVSINGFKMATSGTAKLKNGDLLTMIHDPPFAVISCRFELLGTPPSPKRATKRKSYGVEIIDVKRGTHSQSPDVIFTDGEGTATEPFILTNIREGHTNFPSKKRLREEQEKRQAIISSLTNLSAGGDMPPQVRTLMNTLGNALQCSICLELLHKPIVITPCAHRFCAGCLSTLLGSPTNHNYAANCPNCRGNITSFMKDAQLREVIDGYLNFFPSERQSEEHRNALDAVDYISGREGTSFDFKKPRQTATRGRGRRSR